MNVYNEIPAGNPFIICQYNRFSQTVLCNDSFYTAVFENVATIFEYIICKYVYQGMATVGDAPGTFDE
jgi:hypothetical protein